MVKLASVAQSFTSQPMFEILSRVQELERSENISYALNWENLTFKPLNISLTQPLPKFMLVIRNTHRLVECIILRQIEKRP